MDNTLNERALEYGAMGHIMPNDPLRRKENKASRQEDEDVQRHLLTSFLKNGAGPATVYPAADGQEALDVLLKLRKPIDLVVCDLQMPRVDGLAFLRRANEAGTKPPIAFVSAADPRLFLVALCMYRELSATVGSHF